MNIWYINHYASPPGCGRGERPLHIARALQRHEHTPLIIAASHHHLQFTVGATRSESSGAEGKTIPFHFVPTRTYSRNSGVQRLLGMLDFARGVGKLAKAVDAGTLTKPDVIICSSPHPFAYPNVQRIAKAFGAKVIFEERDL